MSGERRVPNADLIDEPGSRAALDTPVLLLDLDAFEANLATMAAFAKTQGVGLRPHAKTHKCAEIARRQQALGAVGICCAKVSEAEALAAAGIDHILITGNVIGETKIGRLLELNARLRDLAVVSDDPDNVLALGEAAAARGQELAVLVLADVGSHRFGVTAPAGAVEVAKAIAAQPALRLAGLQGYAGFLQHVHDYGERAAAAKEASDRLAACRDAILAAGLPCDIVTGSGTGSHDFDARGGVFTDLQVGSYIFMDADYDPVTMAADAPHRFANSLFVATQVVSNRQDGFVTTDAGSKCFALDGPAPVIAKGAPEGSTYRMFGDQFGRVDLPNGHRSLPLATRLEIIPPHCDPTVNLYDHLHVVQGDRLVAIWRIEGRGGVW